MRLLLAVAILLVGCAAEPVRPSPAVAWPRWADGAPLPSLEPRMIAGGAAGGGVTLRPGSQGVGHGTVYDFALGHCGLLSPVDLDGSFWDPIDGVHPDGTPVDLATAPEAINATRGLIVVLGDEARFRTEGGAVIRFARHPGEKAFPACE